LTDCFDEQLGRVMAHMVGSGALTDEPWRRDEPWSLKRCIYDRKVRPAELVGQQAADTASVRKHDPVGSAVIEAERWSFVGCF